MKRITLLTVGCLLAECIGLTGCPSVNSTAASAKPRIASQLTIQGDPANSTNLGYVGTDATMMPTTGGGFALPGVRAYPIEGRSPRTMTRTPPRRRLRRRVPEVQAGGRQ